MNPSIVRKAFLRINGPEFDKKGRRRRGGLRALAEALHDSDLHQGVYDPAGDMNFCPGCRVHTLLLRIEAETGRASAAAFLAATAAMRTEVRNTIGESLEAGDL